MKKLIIEPDGWARKLNETRPGLFVFRETLCFRDEYNGQPIVCDSGEIFWGGVVTKEERGELMVQPVVSKWVDCDGE